jgi:hypothetical protein
MGGGAIQHTETMTTLKDIANALEAQGGTGCFLGFTTPEGPNLATKGGMEQHVELFAAYVKFVAGQYKETPEAIAAKVYYNTLLKLGIDVPDPFTAVFFKPDQP